MVIRTVLQVVARGNGRCDMYCIRWIHDIFVIEALISRLTNNIWGTILLMRTDSNTPPAKDGVVAAVDTTPDPSQLSEKTKRSLKRRKQICVKKIRERFSDDAILDKCAAIEEPCTSKKNTKGESKTNVTETRPYVSANDFNGVLCFTESRKDTKKYQKVEVITSAGFKAPANAVAAVRAAVELSR
ncbi:hypothetical protein Tco_0435833 [Tanacetum coccineum]